ncbi:MAG: DUF2779 domain-containing protein [Dehalococcoidia bacterium]|nr:DUF2779 domain-containing protein [Dehalococcoidia bacterium]
MNNAPRDQIPLLSKSRFMAGLQCHKRLYLECYHRDLADEISASQQSIFDAGTEVGVLARKMYSGGILIGEDHLYHEESVKSTATMLCDRSIPAIYEAGFLFDDVRVRVDILARVEGDAFDLIEVKSNTELKDEHLYDIGIQAYVLQGCGIKVKRAYLCHIDTDYVYQGGDYDLRQLFELEDITRDTQRLQSEIPTLLAMMRSPLQKLEPPNIQIGRQCTKPYDCPFSGYCHQDEPEHHISQLPRASETLLSSLKEAGINDIRDIPVGFPGLNAMQQRVRDCVVDNRWYLDPHLSLELSQLEYPVHFLDFETFNPVLPLYPGTRPYQVIPFQWSDHILGKDGVLSHEAFLYDGFDDPRESFARSLLASLGESGSIVVYSGFEESRIRDLALALPHLSGDLMSILDGRIVDLLKLIRKYCYHPEFHGSFSIKAVLPALVSNLGYDDLDIGEGGTASAAYAEMIRPETTPERREWIRGALLAYCKRDTQAEVHLVKVLRNRLETSSSQ